MPARRLDGIAVADAIRAEVRPMVEAFTARAGRPPGLGLVLVGEDPASTLYVTSKLKSAAETGLRADLQRLPAILVRRGYSAGDIAGIMHGNWIRKLSESLPA